MTKAWVAMVTLRILTKFMGMAVSAVRWSFLVNQVKMAR